jgi:hypothetical protein
MKSVIDGQRQPRPPDLPLDLLDGIGLDLRMTALPQVIEHQTMQPFYRAGGWVETELADL